MCKLGCEKYLGDEPWSIHSTGFLWLSCNIYFSSQLIILLKNWLLSFLLRSIEHISYRFSFCFSSNKCGTHLFSFFTFSMAFKWVEIVKMDTLSTTLSSRTVDYGFDSTNVISCSFSMEGFWSLPSSSASPKSPLRNLANQRRIVASVTLPSVI